MAQREGTRPDGEAHPGASASLLRTHNALRHCSLVASSADPGLGFQTRHEFMIRSTLG